MISKFAGSGVRSDDGAEAWCAGSGLRCGGSKASPRRGDGRRTACGRDGSRSALDVARSAAFPRGRAAPPPLHRHAIARDHGVRRQDGSPAALGYRDQRAIKGVGMEGRQVGGLLGRGDVERQQGEAVGLEHVGERGVGARPGAACPRGLMAISQTVVAATATSAVWSSEGTNASGTWVPTDRSRPARTRRRARGSIDAPLAQLLLAHRRQRLLDVGLGQTGALEGGPGGAEHAALARRSGRDETGDGAVAVGDQDLLTALDRLDQGREAGLRLVRC